MINNFLKNTIKNSSDKVLNLESTAVVLGISTATVRNWVKCGYLQSLGEGAKYSFHTSEIENIKLNISSGVLEKLNKRANKEKANRTFTPDEYLTAGNAFDSLNIIVDFIKCNNIDLGCALFLVCLNILRNENILSPVTIENVAKEKNLIFSNKQIGEEVKTWLSEIEKKNLKINYSFLLDCHIPEQRDVLGYIYQSLLLEGKKSHHGSYYTPSIIVDEIVSNYVKNNSKVLDPCCGTGQFLLAFADIVENPSDIYGVDIDEMAVRIARLNILIKYKNNNFIPNIVCKNALFDIDNYDLFNLNDEDMKNFDVIATNPPWGVHFSNEAAGKLKILYPEISSLDSFSYFIKKSIDLIKDSGKISFILPESILNVKTHKDIREIILKNTHIKKIVYLDRVFKNVFTPVIRLDMQKSKAGNSENNILINKGHRVHSIAQSDFLYNENYIFDIDSDNLDRKILSKIQSKGIVSLEGNAEWGLGIVTGDNKKHLVLSKNPDNEEVVRGKDVEKYRINNSGVYLKFIPGSFQQVAPEKKYREKEKVVYRFISKKLIFAIDNKQRLTLNSANFFIPFFSKEIPNKVIVALFNSSLYQFYFQKKFNSIKVLRSHIGNMTLPIFADKENNEIIDYVDKIVGGEDCFKELDSYIMKKFELSLEEKKYVIEYCK